MVKEHKHKFKVFIEEGCIDDRVYYVCDCGEYLNFNEYAILIGYCYGKT